MINKRILYNLKTIMFLVFIIVIILIDIVTKELIINNMFLHETKPLISCLNLLHEHNYGIAFGLLSNNSILQKWLLIIIVTIILTFIIKELYNTQNKIKKIAYSMIIGGAIGNLLNRIFYGFVIDFIDFHIFGWHFATFNFADCNIFVGIIFLIKENFFSTCNLK